MAAGIPEPNYGCGPIDVGCQIAEGSARITVSIVTALGNFIADMFVNAFKDSTIADASWKVAGGQFWFWAAIVAGFVAVVMIWQVSVGVLLRDHKRMASAMIGGTLSIPFSVFAVTWMMRLTTASDKAAILATKQLQGQTLSDSLLRFIGLTAPDDSGKQQLTQSDWDTTSTIVSIATGGTGDASANLGQVILAALIVGLLAVASLLLFLLMEVRNMGLLALAAMAPLALMFIGQPVLVAWAKRWASLVVGLILAKPIAAGILVLLVKLSGQTPDLGSMIVFAGGVVVAAFAPMWAVKLVNFAGDELGNAMARRTSMTQQINKVQAVRGLGSGLGRAFGKGR